MKESEDRTIEKLIGKVMKQSALEKPSIDFTSLVMGEVENIKTNVYTTYEPLISKRTWGILICGFLVFVGGIAWFGNTETSGWFENSNFDFLNSNGFTEIFKGIKLSQTTKVSILMFALMLLIQIPFLKNYFDKRVLN